MAILYELQSSLQDGIIAHNMVFTDLTNAESGQ